MHAFIFHAMTNHENYHWTSATCPPHPTSPHKSAMEFVGGSGGGGFRLPMCSRSMFYIHFSWVGVALIFAGAGEMLTPPQCYHGMQPYHSGDAATKRTSQNINMIKRHRAIQYVPNMERTSDKTSHVAWHPTWQYMSYNSRRHRTRIYRI